MSSLTLDAVIQKFEILPESAKREVADFIDFLLQKRYSRTKKIDKKMLLEISQWTDEDITAVEDAGKEINKWQLETFK
ncbi:MAG TPA: DUF2281 domain-containing protein [Candidatus Deferrimicrobium sp.]|nr:DUF2281 domain-containing protein [Candidatus Deferrimicrobium sp.]